jgi:hypothetical protein
VENFLDSLEGKGSYPINCPSHIVSFSPLLLLPQFFTSFISALVLLYSLKDVFTYNYLDLRNNKRALTAFPAFFVLATAMMITPAMDSAASTSQGNNANFSIPVKDIVQVSAPPTANISVLSISGDGYSLQTATEQSANVLTFTPNNVTVFTIVLNVSSSSGSNYADVTKQSTPLFVQACSNCNFTGSGNLIVSLNINATNSSAQTGSVWDPLTGMLPLKVQNLALSFVDLMIILSGFGFAFLALGIGFRSKVLYLGLALLFILGIVEFGLIVMFGIIAAYLVSFALINVFSKHRFWRSKR